jgi:hypothetical protein
VTPQQQHPVPLVQQHHHCRPVQPHHVMPDPLPVRQLYVHLAEPHPRVVIDHPLAERLPPTRPTARRITHTPTLTRPRHESLLWAGLLQPFLWLQGRAERSVRLAARATDARRRVRLPSANQKSKLSGRDAARRVPGDRVSKAS